MVVCTSVLVLHPFCRRYFPSLLSRDGEPSEEVFSPEAKGSGGHLKYDSPSGPQSKSEYRTKVRGGKSKGSSRSRNLWSLSFANTTKADDEDVESLDTELKRLPPTAADMGGGGPKIIVDDRDGLSTLRTKSGDGVALRGAGAGGQTISSPPQVPSRTWNREPKADEESGIIKTVSLDVRGQAH